MTAATTSDFARFAGVLEALAGQHGLSNLRVCASGEMVADIAYRRTMLDLARFELEASSLTGADIIVISSGAPLAATLDSTPLRAVQAA